MVFSLVTYVFVMCYVFIVEYSNKRVLYLVLALLLLPFLIFKTELFEVRDLQNYIHIVELIKSGNEPDRKIEFTFVALSKLALFFTNSDIVYSLVLLFYALPSMVTKFYFFSKESKCCAVSFMIYFSSFFFLHEFVQVRIGLALAIILFALVSDKIAVRFLFFIISLSVHQSIVFMAPFIFLQNFFLKKNVILVVYILSFIIVMFGGNLVESSLTFINSLLSSDSRKFVAFNTTDILSTTLIPYLFIFILYSVVGSNNVISNFDRCAVCIFIYAMPLFWLFGFNSVMAYRLFEMMSFFSVFAIPCMFEKKSLYFIAIVYSLLMFLLYIGYVDLVGALDLNFI